MTKKVKRKDSDNLSPEELSAAVEAFKQRREERMTSDEETAPETPDAIDGDIEEEDEETAVPAVGEGEQDNVQIVKDRRDRRDAEGDPEDLDRAMGVIAQQDEDIDTLLGVIDVLQAANTDSDDEPQNEDEEENSDEGEEEPVANADRADSNDFRELLRVVRIGDKLNMDGLESMSVKNAKKEVLKKLKPALRMDGKSAAYISAAFDMAVAEMKTRKDTNYQRGQMMNKDSKSTAKSVGSANDARERMINKMKKEDK